MTDAKHHRSAAVIALAASLILTACATNPQTDHRGEPSRTSGDRITEQMTESETTMPENEHPYIGLWVTADRHVRHELLPGGRYVEARGSREAAYTGGYTVTDDHIEYVDDTGFTADGDFVDANTLHHAGMVLTREDQN